jgi:predicted RNase H-like HicB family nuclease
MAIQTNLTDYVNRALDSAVYDKLDDGSVAGRVPECPGAIAFGRTVRECESELRDTLKDWTLVGLKQGHQLPIIAGTRSNL